MEYRSSTHLLGLPLFHFATGTAINGQYRRGVAVGWVAIGDLAIGVLFACGGICLGGVSLGGAALGLVSIGGLALGGLAIGGLGVGVVAIGGAAVAWYAAVGGFAVAQEYAMGGVAFARNVIGSPPTFGSRGPIPHPPFRAPDAVLLAVIVAGLVAVARAVQRRRE
jgi:hypothetical protein